MVKTTIAQDIVLAYPDYNQKFEIYTDASATQLGVVMIQNNRPLALFLEFKKRWTSELELAD